MKIYAIGAGHGGESNGCEVISDGVIRQEDNLNLAIAVRVHELLLEKKKKSILIRDSDKAMTFSERNAAAKDADLVISIHHDWNPNPDHHGAFAMTYPGNKWSRFLADSILNYFPQELRPTRLFISSSSDWRKRGHHVLSSYSASTILLECGRMSNKADLDFLTKAGTADILARSIVNGILSP